MKKNNYTQEEIKIIEKKIYNSKETVMCPRCGRELLMKSYKNGEKLYCKTEGCITEAIRGI